MSYSVLPNSPWYFFEASAYAAAASSALAKYPRRMLRPLILMLALYGLAKSLSAILSTPLIPSLLVRFSRRLRMFSACVANRKFSSLLSRGLVFLCSTSIPSGIAPRAAAQITRCMRTEWLPSQSRNPRTAYPLESDQFQCSTKVMVSESITETAPLVSVIKAVPLNGSTYIGLSGRACFPRGIPTRTPMGAIAC